MRTIQGELSKWASKNKMPLKKQRDKKVKAKPRSMTTREVQELMGVYKPTYHRYKGGALDKNKQDWGRENGKSFRF